MKDNRPIRCLKCDRTLRSNNKKKLCRRCYNIVWDKENKIKEAMLFEIGIVK